MTTHFPCGHARTPENIYAYVRPDTGHVKTYCKTCKLSQWREKTSRLAAFIKPERPKAPKYKGQKAGKIVIGRGARWGASLV